MNFTTIDFETATCNRNSACAVGIVTVENGKITDEYYSLIKPPNNEYNWHNIQVHGITESDTRNALTFNEIYPEIKKRLQGKVVVAHNESFDRSVLQKTMVENGLNYSELNLPERWECTLRYKEMCENILEELFDFLLELYSDRGLLLENYSTTNIELEKHFGEYVNNYKRVYETEGIIPKRIVCDFITGMTDGYALNVYKEIKIPKPIKFK